MSLTSCHCCGLIQHSGPENAEWCSRCRTRLRSQQGIGTDNIPAAALAVTAMAFFPIAVLAPFLKIQRLGFTSEASLLGGIRSLFENGHLFVATVVMLFSIVLPAIKLTTLLALSLSPRWFAAHKRALTFRAVEHLGRWGMLDVLLVAVLVAFVKIGDLVAFETGPGLYLFVTFVTLNLLAGLVFNPHGLWTETMTDSEATNPQSETDRAYPTAQARPPRRGGWWLVAGFGVVAAMIAGWSIWPDEPSRVVVSFENGHGLRPGDDVNFRGISVGSVEDLALDHEEGRVDVTLALDEQSAELARGNTLWWIVRPSVSFSGADGLDTVLGGKYITLRPGDGDLQTDFYGQERPPLIDRDYPGGREIIVQATSGPRLSPGAGVFHRGVRVGGVDSVGLATDASAIEYNVYIRPGFEGLVTTETRFWNTGGMTVGIGMDGLTVRVDSIAEVITGGIAMAVPERGTPAPAGSRFILYEEPDDEWVDWRPVLEQQDATAIAVPEMSFFRAVSDGKSWSEMVFGANERSGAVIRGREAFWSFESFFPTTPKSIESILVEGRPVAVEHAVSESDFIADASRAGSSLRMRGFKVPEDGYLVAPNAKVFLSAAQWIREGERFRIPKTPRIIDGSLLIATDETILAYVIDDHLIPADTQRLVKLSSILQKSAKDDAVAELSSAGG